MRALKSLVLILALIAGQALAENQPYGIVKGVNGQWPIIQCYNASNASINCVEHWVIGTGTQDPLPGNGLDGDLFWRTDLRAFRTKSSGVWGALTLGTTSFPLLAPNGTGTTPSYSFASDSRSGLYLDSGYYMTLMSINPTGVDQLGGATQIYPGKGTGTNASGTVYIGSCQPGSASGTTQNACSNIALFQSAGNILLGNVTLNAPNTPILNQLYGSVVAAGRTDVSATPGGWAFRGSVGTGTGGGGGFSFGIAPASTSSSSTQNAIQNVFILDGATSAFTLGGVNAPSAAGSTLKGVNDTVTDAVGGNVAISGGNATAGNANGGNVTMDGGAGVGTGIKGFVQLLSRTFTTLGTPANGSIAYCSDCTIANPCAGSGTGAIAKRLNAVWVCN
jgi:hypothetical protein